MADERIGASFTIDVNNLKAGLKTANNLIRESQAEFKAAAAGLDKYSDAEKIAQAKIKSLNGIIPQQEQKVEALKKQYQKLVNEGLDETSDRAIKLRTNIKKEEAALKENEAELKKQQKALENVGEATDDVSQKTEKTSGSFTVMKGALANFVALGFNAAIKGAKKLASELINVGVRADELNTLSKQSGFSTAEIQKFDYAAELIDVDTNTIIDSAKKMKKNMVSNSKETAAAFKTLGVAVKDGNGEIRNSNTVFYEVIAALKDVANETERDTIAMQLFGRNADELAGIIDDGGAALRKYGEEAESLGVIMSQDALDSANAFNDSIDRIKATGQGVFYAIGTEIAKALIPEVNSAQSKFQAIVKSGQLKNYTQKVTETIKSAIKVAKEIGKTVIPFAANAVKFLADNFKTLATVTLTAVTVFKAFKAVMAVTTAITAAKSAVAELTGTVTIATKAQTIWNAAMAANPIGAVLTAVGLLAAGIGILIAKQKSAADATDELNESQDEAITKAHEAAEAYRDQVKASAEQAAAEVANVDYVQNTLLPQLQNLVVANGKVKDGEEARAQFILGELNKALGTEYTQLSDIVDANGKIKDSIYKTIEAKKAQILLEAHEEDYKKAVFEVSKAETARTKALLEMTTAQDEVTEATKKAKKAQEDFLNLSISGDEASAAQQNLKKAKKILKEKTEAVEKAEADVKLYYNNIDSYQQASTAILKGETDKAINILQIYSGAFVTAESLIGKTLDEKKKILEQQVIYAEINYQTLEADYKEHEKEMSDEQKKAAKQRIENAKKQADDAKQEFKNVGGNITKGMAEGAKEQEWQLSDKIKGIVSKAVKVAKDVLGIKSPSRVFRNQVGQMIGEGIALGVDDSTKGVLNSVKNQVKAIQREYDFGGFDNAVSVNGSNAGGVNNSKSVVVNQYNTYAQAHSRYEIYKSQQQTAAAVRLALGTV